MNINVSTARSRASVRWMTTEYATTLAKGDSAGLIGIFESRVPAGEGPPLHVHHNEDEVLHILEGQYEFWLDGATSKGGPGTSVFLPRGVPHSFRVLGDKPGRNLAIVTPGGFESFFGEAAARDLLIPRDMAELIELASRYGLEFLGPVPWVD
jgi:quercetin dioxygenase-like cupin family protein